MALMISGISLGVAVYQGWIQQKMLTASSWPHLEFTTGNMDGAGTRELSFTLRNSGVGPAKVQSFEIFVDGKPIRNVGELLRVCCDVKLDELYAANVAAPSDQPYSLLTTTPSDIVVRPGEEITVLRWRRAKEAPPSWAMLDAKRRTSLKVAVCYCSIFDDCWRRDSTSVREIPVLSCPRSERSFQG